MAFPRKTLTLPSGRKLSVSSTSAPIATQDNPSRIPLAEGGVTMTRQNFELIARVLAKADPPNMHPEFMDRLIESFADALAESNPSFDRGRFIKAAGG